MKKFLIGFVLLLSIATISLINITGKNIIKAGVGDTIADTFPDTNMAQAVANSIAGGDVDAVITPALVTSTTSLSLGFSNITNIEGIEVFQNLSTFYIYGNNLTYLPDSFSNLINLNYLDLSSNQLTSLPDGFGNLSNLKELNLNMNNLTTLPDSFSNFSHLTYLGIAENNLTSLPSSIGNLNNLIYLDLNFNHLTSLPDIGNLNNLEGISLHSNQLTSLPASFINLNSLQWGEFGENLFPTGFETSLPNVIVYPGTTFDQLVLQNGITPIDITGQNDLDNLDLASMVFLQSQRTLSPSHEYILDDFLDENNDPIDLKDYISPSGAVIKEGKVFTSIRATGTGLFPNNSDHAVTIDKIELNFIITLYEATFDLNGGEGTAPASQQVAEGSLLTAVADPLRNGYTFIGWNTAIDGSGTTWNFTTNTMPGEDITLYATWEKADNTTADNIPQTGMNTYLIAGVIALFGGTSLILLTKVKRNQ